MAVFVIPSDDYPTIADALQDAQPGDEIRLEPGYSGESAVVSVNSLIFVGDGSNTGISLTPNGISAITLQGLSAQVPTAATLSTLIQQGGTLTVDGTYTAASTGQAIVQLRSGAVLNADDFAFGAGTTNITLMDIGTTLSIGAGSVHMGQDGFDQIRLWDGATLDASQSTFIVDSATPAVASALIVMGTTNLGFPANPSTANFGTLDVRGNGDPPVWARNGGVINVADDVLIGTTANSGSGTFSSGILVSGTGARLIVGDDMTIGSETPLIDGCGDWQNVDLTRGRLRVESGGYASIGDTLTIAQNGFMLDLTTGGSLEVGGNNGYVSNQLRVDAGGEIEGHGTLNAGNILNNGTIEAREGQLTLDGNITGSGVLQIDEAATLQINDDVAATVTVSFDQRPNFGDSFRFESKLILRDPDNFEGTISGLELGDTIIVDDMALPAWTGLAQPEFSHAEINQATGELDITFIESDNLATNVTVNLALGGNLANQTFAYRNIPNGDLGLSFVDDSPQVQIHVDGTPTNGNSPYVDSLINGWAAWNAGAGPITFCFADADDIHTAVDTHGETFEIRCEDDPSVTSSTVIGDWNEEEKAAFRSVVSVFESATGLDFQETTDAGAANLVWWLVPDARLLPGANADSEHPVVRPDGHVWQFFSHEAPGWENLDFGGEGRNTMLHELGHALGLVHPHDGGNQSDGTIFPGVTETLDPMGQVIGYTTGTNGQNQNVYTVMSDNAGLEGNIEGEELFGDQGGLGAFDIAALQELYGRNLTTRTGNDTYSLPTANGEGTGWSGIWDAGGIDTISNVGANIGSVIDLRAAPLVGPNAGGYISRATGIEGGFTIAAGVVIENAIGGNGEDRITGNDAANHLEGNNNNDTLIGLGGIDQLDGGDGNDTLIGNGGDALDGGPGNDLAIVDLAGFTSGITFTFDEPAILQTLADGTSLINVERLSLRLGTGNDRVTTRDLDDIVDGGGGDDVLEGLGGGDLLIEGPGADTLDGGPGNDTYEVDSSADKIIDSSGLDTVKSTVSWALSEGLEHLTLLGSASINGTGNAAANTIAGNAAKNTLKGLGGNDPLKGLDGNDVLTGGKGRDVLYGGAGKDFFDFNSINESLRGSKRDKIMDFKRGQDHIDLKDIDAQKGGGNQKFKWIGKKDFSDKKGELRYEDKGSKVIVQGDVNGDGKADFEIYVAAGSFSKGDFLL